MLPRPVPPFATGSVPVTSDVRFMSDVESAPAVAFKKPFNVVLTCVRFGAEVSVPSDDVALSRASTSALIIKIYGALRQIVGRAYKITYGDLG